MPLVWAHAEHIKLCRSLADGAVFDCPPQTLARYVQRQTPARVQPWRPDWRATTLRAGLALRLDLADAASVTWSADDWATQAQVSTTEFGSDLHVAELATTGVAAGRTIRFRLGDAEHSVAVGT
jgi:glucoamylase